MLDGLIAAHEPRVHHLLSRPLRVQDNEAPMHLLVLIGHELRAYRQTGQVIEETRMQPAREAAPQGHVDRRHTPPSDWHRITTRGVGGREQQVRWCRC
jgi:hypothetical protein